MHSERIRVSQTEMADHYANRKPGETAAMRATAAYEADNPDRRVTGSVSDSTGFYLVVMRRGESR